MAVIVPAHIGTPPLATPVDIPFGTIKTAAQATVATAPTVDPAVPRGAFAHAFVAAAAVALPTLTPTLPSQDPEYRLSSKRKAPDDDEPENAPGNLKRLRTDDDPLFGSLSQSPPIPSPQPAIAPSNDVLTYTLEQALVAILTTPQEPTPQPQPTPEPTHEVVIPSNPATPSRLPSSPLSSPSYLPSYDVNAPEVLAPVIEKPCSPPPPTRAVEPPIWKVACRTRVEAIVATYGVPAVRAIIAQEASRWIDRSRPGSAERRRAVESTSPLAGSDLKVAIYTPSHFTTSSDPEECEKSELDFEEDVDMSFDFDDDSDMESEEEEEEEDDDDDQDTEDDSSPHESLLDVSVVGQSPAEGGSGASPRPLDAPIPAPISIPEIPPMMAPPPPFPNLCGIPVYCLRTYPDLLGLGTPSRAAPWARGNLNRANVPLHLQPQLR